MSETPMVSLTIEGRAVTVPAGTSILEAAKHAGVLIPHYCYHSGLPVAGVCRMCLVEVEKFPKLAPSCVTAAAEGQVVHVYSEKALEARKGVLEMLLINHPLDCPICDQSGECELQDYTSAEGRVDSRYREPKRFNPAEDFGGDVMYVANRCILCTRCVRFMADVHQNPVLAVSERGDRAHIDRAPDAGLTQPWAANVVDLCPVGALLSKDFLNKARAWELDRTASICPGCSQGCNIMIETRDNVVVRLKPRGNDAVNKFFMCDEGRLNYRWINRADRLATPLVSGRPVEWNEAIATAAKALEGKRAYVIGSPSLSNEALYLLGRLAAKTGGSAHISVPQGAEAPLPGVDDLAVRADRAANATGATLLGFSRDADPLARLAGGDVLVLADDAVAAMGADAWSRADAVIVLGTTPSAAAVSALVALPTTNFAEEEGTFTNLRGRVQRFLQARQGPGLARASWQSVAAVLGALGVSAEYHVASEVFDALSRSEPAFAGLTYDGLALRGAVAQSTTAGVAR